MKKYLVIIIIMIEILSISKAFSQEPCDIPTGCESYGTGSVLLYGCLTVGYSWAICDGFAYFKIEDITAVAPCVPYAPFQVISDAGFAILSEPWADPVKAAIPSGECEYNISGFAASCYKWVQANPNPGDGGELIPCHSETCCVTNWVICNYYNGNYITLKNGSSDAAPCVYPLTQGCFPVCEYD